MPGFAFASGISTPDPQPTARRYFLFTDIEGSTLLIQSVGARYASLVEEHRRLIREQVAAHDGTEQDSEGDSFFAVFETAASALRSAAGIQRAFANHRWPCDASVLVRIGLHAGRATRVNGCYYGLDVHRAAWVCAAAHGGQILLSGTVADDAANALPPGVELRDFGEQRLKDLAGPERLFQADVAGLRRHFPPPRTLEVARNNLPVQRTSFVGRARELAASEALLRTVRLLSLTGPGGTGKTRLAIHVSAAVANEFPNGVCFVPLAPVSEPGLVLAAIATALGIPDDGGRPTLDLVAESLRSKRLLLVLDNFERLLAAAVDVSRLLDRTLSLRILVTSRAPLRVYGEQELDVPPLRLPDENWQGVDIQRSDAVRLFVDRARAVKWDFSLNPDNAADVAAVCRRVEGLPLAIELAAGRVREMSPAAIRSALGRRLALLTGGPRDLAPRQRSLRATIAWSHDLLDGPAQHLFAVFSVFVGGAELPLVEQVAVTCEALPNALAQLVEHSLIRRREGDGSARFQMLETIREFAAERLAEHPQADAVRQRHAEAFLSLAETTAPSIMLPDGRVLLDMLDSEKDNMRSALAWFCRTGQASAALRLGTALWRFWQMRGHLAEARQHLQRVLELPSVGVDPYLRLRALEAAGGVAYWQGDVVAAERFYRTCLKESRSLGDPSWAARSLSCLAYTRRAVDPTSEEVLAMATTSLEAFRALADDDGAAGALRLIALLRTARGELVSAGRAAEAARRLFERLDRPFDIAWTLRQIGMLHLKQDDVESAEAALCQALRLFADARDVSSIPVLLGDLAAVADARADHRRALRLFGAAAAMQASSGAQWAEVVDQLEKRGAAGGQREPRDPAWAEGAAMTVEDALGYALAP